MFDIEAYDKVDRERRNLHAQLEGLVTSLMYSIPELAEHERLNEILDALDNTWNKSQALLTETETE